MRCSDVARILPELVSGEVDQKTAQKAKEHIAACSRCAAEREAYEDALAALASPREEFELPERLAVLDLPEDSSQRRLWLRPVFALGALAVLILFAALAPGLHKAPARLIAKSPSHKVQSEKQPAVKYLPKDVPEKPVTVVILPDTSPVKKHSITREQVKTAAVRFHSAGRRVRKHKSRVAIHTQQKPQKQQVVQTPPPEQMLPMPEPKRLLVVAMRPADEPSVINITVTDASTGNMRQYTFERDATGCEQETVTQYSSVSNDDRRILQ